MIDIIYHTEHMENRRGHTAVLERRIPTNIRVNDSVTAQILAESIREAGQIPYSRFMETSLYGPDGYYNKGKVEFGANNDFTTSPTESELFGASIGQGLWKTWNAIGKPETFDIVEMGAGEGELAADLLRYAKDLHPDFHEAIRYIIVEYGRDLIPRQRKRIGNNPKVSWIQGSAFELPVRNITGAFISNELPDIFPVDLVTRMNGEVRQKYIGIENNEWVEIWDKPSPEVAQHIESFELNIKDVVLEPINISSARFQKEMDQALERGVILTIDYGKNHQVGRTTQGVRYFGPKAHRGERYAEFLYPGEVDITSDVNFKVLEDVARQDGLVTAYSDTQPGLLDQLGIFDIIDDIRKNLGPNPHLSDVIDAGKVIASAIKIVGSKGFSHNYHAQLLLKGVAREAILDSNAKNKTTDEMDERIKKKALFPFRVRDCTSNTVIITSNRGRVNTNPKDGVIMMYPENVPSSVIRSADRNDWSSWDLTNKNVLKMVVEDSGYRID